MTDMERYREKYPESWEFPDEYLTGTMSYQRFEFSLRVEELKVELVESLAPLHRLAYLTYRRLWMVGQWFKGWWTT